jgi:hypothetical protein
MRVRDSRNQPSFQSIESLKLSNTLERYLPQCSHRYREHSSPARPQIRFGAQSSFSFPYLRFLRLPAKKSISESLAAFTSTTTFVPGPL